MPVKRTALVIGSGFAGISAATFLASEGWDVTVIEKNATPGGRARQLIDQGFTFDMGPSFYWMPDVFDRYFTAFGKKVSDYYKLHRLDPSYRIYWDEGYDDIPADLNELKKLFDQVEPGSGLKLEKYLSEAEYKYEAGMKRLVYKPGQSLAEFMDWQTISGVLRLDVFTNIKKHIARYFTHPRLRQLMEFPVLFLGALPEDTPALYSLMNYADIKGGTWYPEGGMYSVVDAMYQLAREKGVKFRFNEPVISIDTKDSYASGVTTAIGKYEGDVVISGADYHFTESSLLPAAARGYSEKYWDKRVMAPSCLLYYVGLDVRVNDAVHHSLFFDVPFAQHGHEIYKDPKWPTEPLFYVSMASVTDKHVAPEGAENLVFLVPVAAGLANDTEELRDEYFEKIFARFEKKIGQSLRAAIIYKRSYSVSDFAEDYNSYRGNAYGLANTLMQTAILRPSCRSRKLSNLFFTGQLTVPGPGVPPSLISGEVVAKEVMKNFK